MDSVMSRPCAGCVAIVLLWSSALVSAQVASGRFTAQPEGTITPTIVAAYVVRDQFNPREREIEASCRAQPLTSRRPSPNSIRTRR